ncbi:MAG TPA: ParB/RepB/Spo0J family partition protein [Planctomycetes bacterium]|nr:ParB/RepB/Spo0J family partition protein [Planctomycetota bacterium]
MTREKRLGRGLEALLGRVAAKETPPQQPETPTADVPPEAIIPLRVEEPGAGENGPAPPTTLPVDRIEDNPFQPRQDFNDHEILALAESLRSHGLLQPIVVRPSGDHFQLVAGQRRLLAAAQAGWTEVPVQVVEADDRQAAELALVENLQRKDLNPLEKAACFQRYLQQYGSTHEELASRLQLDRSTVSNLIRLLELPEPVQEAVRRGKISQGHARALLPLGDQREQIAFCEKIQAEGLSVRRTETLVQEMIRAADAEPLAVIGRDGSRRRRTPSAQIAALEEQFRHALGTKVHITQTSRGRGKVVIHFASHDEFERLRHQICQTPAPGAEEQVG